MPMNESEEEARNRAREAMRQGLLAAKQMAAKDDTKEGARSRANSLLDAPMSIALPPTTAGE